MGWSWVRRVLLLFIILDKEERCVFCTRVSAGFRFRSGDSRLVSVTPFTDFFVGTFLAEFPFPLSSYRASHSCWPDSLKEMVCVDSSGPMNTLADRLLRGKTQPLKGIM